MYPLKVIITVSRQRDLAAKRDLVEDLVDGEHERADTDVLEALAVHAIELGRIVRALGHAPLLVSLDHQEGASREAHFHLEVHKILDPAVALASRLELVQLDELGRDLLGGAVALGQHLVAEAVRHLHDVHVEYTHDTTAYHCCTTAYHCSVAYCISSATAVYLQMHIDDTYPGRI